MESREKVEYWLDIARYDLETAEAMLSSGRFLYTAFMCQQAFEKILKAVVIAKGLEEEPPKSHNLGFLLARLNLESIPPDMENVANRLSAYYIESRYPNYKERLSKLVGKDEAENILEETKEAFAWLRSLLP